MRMEELLSACNNLGFDSQVTIKSQTFLGDYKTIKEGRAIDELLGEYSKCLVKSFTYDIKDGSMIIYLKEALK